MDRDSLFDVRVVGTVRAFGLGAVLACVLPACGGAPPGAVPPSGSGAADGAASGVAVARQSPRSVPAYQGPVAFTVQAEGLTASFVDESSVEVASHEWVFGDGATSTAAAPVHAYSQVGTYEVTESITDAHGNVSTRTLPVRVMPLPPQLQNGVARSGLSAVATYDLPFYVRPPAGATQFEVAAEGAAEGMDVFVKRGSVPTEDSYDCHAKVAGNVATCAFPTPGDGPYYVRIVARKNFSDGRLVARWKGDAALVDAAKSGAVAKTASR